MIQKQKKFEDILLVCPVCQGRGVSCASCRGFGIVLWWNGHLFFWGRPINAFAISTYKIEKFLFQFFNFLFFLFGIIGVLSLGYAVMTFGVIVRFWNISNVWVLIFYCSLLTDAYLFFRLSQKSKTKKIPTIRPDVALKKISSLEAALRLPGKFQHDISHYFNSDSFDVLMDSWEIAARNQHSHVAPLHIFGAFFTKGITNIIFARLNISRDRMMEKMKRRFQKMPRAAENPTLSLESRRALLYAFFEALEKKQADVTLTNLLLGVFLQDANLEDMLYEEDVNLTKMTNVIEWLYIQDMLIQRYRRFRSRAKLKPKTTMNRAMTALSTPLLDMCSQDLTLRAKYGYMDIVVGREREIEELFRIIESGSRSVLLVGDHGVGKRSIIEALAQRMVSEDVPDILRDRRLVSLSVPQLIAGVEPSEAQGRLLRMIEEIHRAGNVILAIESIEDMMGITTGEKESLDLSEVLAKFISLSRVIAIATTTPTNYTRFVQETALGDAFHKITVDEPNVDETIHILEAKVPAVEYEHKVFFSYGALDAAAQLAKRYLHDQYLPEKAVSIIEQTAVYAAKAKGEKSMVTREDVEHIISEKTKIPISRVTQKESEILLHLEEKIHEYMIDQEEAVRIVATSLRRARAQLHDQGRPIVNLLFLGPTGVGKTELAKTVAKIYFGGEGQMIRLDMSEYQDKASVYRLVGAPAGTGEGSEGYLTQAVRRNPFSLVLLDEIEKAHPDILNIFLQVMDDGRLTDNEGHTIDFTNIILIATSNAGTQYIHDEIKKGTSMDDITQGLLGNELRVYYRPEFLNRFDGIVVFKPLSLENVEKIAQLFLKKVSERLEKQGIFFNYTPQALGDIARAGFTPEFGARPLRRAIQEHVDDELAKLLLSGTLTRRDTAHVIGLDTIEVIKAEKL